MLATLAPTIVPTVGGYLNRDAFSWLNWLFFINTSGHGVAVRPSHADRVSQPDYNLV